MKMSRSRFSMKQANDSKTSFTTPLLLSTRHIALLFVVYLLIDVILTIELTETQHVVT